MWQHVQLYEQIRLCDTLACCWDVKQPTSKQTPGGHLATGHRGGRRKPSHHPAVCPLKQTQSMFSGWPSRMEQILPMLSFSSCGNCVLVTPESEKQVDRPGSTHTHIHARARARTHTHTHARARARSHTHTHTHTHRHTHTHTHTHARTHMYTHARERAHTSQAYMVDTNKNARLRENHTQTHTNTRASVDARTYRQTHTRARARTHTHTLTDRLSK